METRDNEQMRHPQPVLATIISPASAARWLIVGIIIAGVYFFHGFIVPVLAALVIALANWPFFIRLRSMLGGNKTLAACVGVLLLLAFIIVPVVLAGLYAVNEIGGWAKWALEVNRNGEPPPQWLAGIPLIGGWLEQLWVEHIGSAGALGQLVQIGTGANVGGIYRALLAAGGGLFSLLLTGLFSSSLFFSCSRTEKHSQIR